MKKMLVMMVALSMMATVASATLGIAWTTWWGGYSHDATDLTAWSHAIRENHNIIWQLIFAGADNVANPPTWNTGGPNGNYVSGDDLVLATRTLPAGMTTAIAPEDGTRWDPWLLNEGGSYLYTDFAWTTPGYVYQRVFQGTPAALTWYYTSALLLINTAWDPMLPPQDSWTEEGYPGWVFPTDSGFKPLQQFPIPEPATMALVGLGAAALAIRRRRA